MDRNPLESELRIERLRHRQYAAVAFTLWLLAAVLAAGWAHAAKGEGYTVLGFAFATFAMLWAVGLVVGLVLWATTILFERR
jgi:hypothetical protein